MVEFETIKSEEVKFGNNNFIEVARKRAISEDGTNEFIAVSRGFFAPDGSKRFKKSFTIPDDSAVIDFIVNNIREMTADASAGEESAPEEPAAEEAAPEEESVEETPEEPAEKSEEAPAEEASEEETKEE